MLRNRSRPASLCAAQDAGDYRPLIPTPMTARYAARPPRTSGIQPVLREDDAAIPPLHLEVRPVAKKAEADPRAGQECHGKIKKTEAVRITFRRRYTSWLADDGEPSLAVRCGCGAAVTSRAAHH